ncbi:acyl-homoserine-lactone synthase [Bradyrhizobium sp. CSA112]|uniref:acyl-homoserine-lactone synthase n=1 Tax=Bradyrhizobium sp. CSA112 TaxID=2699170 RepID=UPI0023B137EA|nr:acyl-homoserine-lactone synthase [Bradyrhizobium sp. CSA112]
MIEAVRSALADSIVTVTDTRMERIPRRAGWPLRRIAAPQQVGSTMAVAGFLDMSEQRSTGCTNKPMSTAPCVTGSC